ncbi:MAG: ASKHA domain-containing protein, partial [Eggerthellaceae bacterium]|nr:ASKHA domain-containing protein [Eggerthellaceae bacterium]
NILKLAGLAGIDIDAPCGGNGSCGKCRVRVLLGTVDSQATRHLAAADFAAGWRLACWSAVAGDATLEVPAAASSFKEGILTADLSTPEQLKLYCDALQAVFAEGFRLGCAQSGFGVAIDIGTTTVSAALLDLATGALCAKASAGNGQIRYGADVINRIIASARPGGRAALRDAVLEGTILPLVEKLCGQAGIEPSAIARCVVAGNTTMEHLFLGEDAESIRLEPYVPAFLEKHGLTAQDAGLPFQAGSPLILAPNVGSYVGGDITAGVLTSLIWEKEGLHLFIDLGTNGELVLGNSDFMLCCACSAGPAFEGGDISCGMRAVDGAIESVRIDEQSFAPQLGVIGSGEAAGICGSGLIDLVAELFRCGLIDASGTFVKECDRVWRSDFGASYVVAFADESATGRDIELSEVDIDNFIRAKAAVFSAIQSMLATLDMEPQALDSVQIAGGIGGGIDIAHAVSIGMLPAIPEARYRYDGNTSLTGACAMLLSDEVTNKVFELGRNMTYLELSCHPGYMDEFVAACFLPHTHAGLFEVRHDQ